MLNYSKCSSDSVGDSTGRSDCSFCGNVDMMANFLRDIIAYLGYMKTYFEGYVDRWGNTFLMKIWQNTINFCTLYEVYRMSIRIIYPVTRE